MRHTIQHPFSRPAVAVDLILFCILENALKVLVGRRAALPHRGRTCLPGSYVRDGESAERACARKIESIGLAHSYLEQLYTFTEPKRDPREHVVSIAYYGLIPFPTEAPVGDDKIDRLEWIDPSAVGEKSWAFDHQAVLAMGLERLRAKIQYAPVSSHFLPKEFTLSELAQVYGAILNRSLDLSNFRRDLLKQDLVVPVGTRAVRGPTATTYAWNWKNKRPFFLSLG